MWCYNIIIYVMCGVYISVQNGNMEMCKLLIDNGALSSINTPNKVNIW